ncbi:MAG: ABC transporter permease [Clostridia bacterium]|nr:ABC transporter permease [Clostridia bacterium]
MKNLKKLLYSQWFVLVIIILLIGTVTTIVNPKFLTWKNMLAIVTQVASLSLVAIGASVMIGSGHFDISVGAIIGLCTCVMAIMIKNGVNEFLVFLAGVALATFCCVLNGSLSIALKAPSFIITMATTGVYTGIGLLLTQGVLQMITGKFRFFSATKVFGSVPIMVVIALAGFVIAYIMLKFTQTGRQIYAIGSNPTAAYLSGINVNASKIKFFAIDGILVGIAAAMYLSRLGSGLPSYGAGMEMNAMGAVVIGGTPISGGKASIGGTLCGVLLIGLISNSLNMMHVDAFWQDIASGALIILALAISAVRTKLAAKQQAEAAKKA